MKRHVHGYQNMSFPGTTLCIFSVLGGIRCRRVRRDVFSERSVTERLSTGEFQMTGAVTRKLNQPSMSLMSIIIKDDDNSNNKWPK